MASPDLVKEVQNVEIQKRGHSIDKRTVRNMVEHLRKEGLVQVKEVKISSEAVKRKRFKKEDSDMSSDNISGTNKSSCQKIIQMVTVPDFDLKHEHLQKVKSLENPFKYVNVLPTAASQNNNTVASLTPHNGEPLSQQNSLLGKRPP